MTSDEREELGYKWLTNILHSGWTATQSTNKYDRWDATCTNGKKVVYTEIKIRDIHSGNIKDEGAIIDKSKADFLYKMGDAMIVQFFPVSEDYYTWNVNEKDNWRVGERMARKNNQSFDKVLKKFYYMPMTDDHRKIMDFDISDYYGPTKESV